MSKHFMPSVALAALMAARPAGIIGTVRNESQNIEKLLGEGETGNLSASAVASSRLPKRR